MSGAGLAIERLGAAAGAPVRWCDDLERATRRVRVLPAAGRPLARVASVPPRELFGAELLDVLGERLRALLAAPGVAPEPETPRGTRSPAWGGAAPARPPGAPADAAPAARRGAPGAPLVEPDRSAGGAPIAGVAPPSRPGPRVAPAGATPVRRSAAPEGEALLARRVRRHAAVAEAVVDGRPGLAAAPPGADGRTPPGPVGAREAAPASAAPLADRAVAERLRAFVEGTRLPAAPPALLDGRPPLAPTGAGAAWTLPAAGEVRAGAPVGPPASGGWVPRPGAAGGGPSRAAGLRDLADDLAEILREQAISHGIDVP